MQQTSWWPLAVVALLAAVTFWLGQVAGVTLPADNARFRHDPDYVVENFAATSYDEEGQPQYRLSARKMVHYMDDDSTELDEPKLERKDVDMPTMRVRADRGLISSDGENVYFLGGVVVSRDRSAKDPVLEMKTDYIRIVPEADIMRTDKPIVMRQGSSTIEAAGMFADAEKRYFELAGRVKAIYEQQH